MDVMSLSRLKWKSSTMRLVILHLFIIPCKFDLFFYTLPQKTTITHFMSLSSEIFCSLFLNILEGKTNSVEEKEIPFRPNLNLSVIHFYLILMPVFFCKSKCYML